MRNVVELESAEELLEAKGSKTVGKIILPQEVGLKICVSPDVVELFGPGSEGWVIGPNLTAKSVIEAMAAKCGFTNVMIGNSPGAMFKK